MEELVCPKCKEESIKKGALSSSFGQVHMFPENQRGKSSPISADYCNNCGYVLSLYVDNPTNIE